MNHIIKPAGEAFSRDDYPDDAIFFFDFDGVLADQEEEKIFRLEETPMERNELEILAGLMGIEASLYPSTKSLRHLVYQAQVFDLPVKSHPEALEFAQDLSDALQPFSIVTARSGLWAVERMLNFVRESAIFPQEVFCLGRASKALLFEKLRKDWPNRPFVYFEDSKHHIEETLALCDPLMTVVEVQWDTCHVAANALRYKHLGIT